MPKRSRTSDPNVLAARIISEVTAVRAIKDKNPAAVALGRLGGLKGGIASGQELIFKGAF